MPWFCNTLRTQEVESLEWKFLIKLWFEGEQSYSWSYLSATSNISLLHCLWFIACAPEFVQHVHKPFEMFKICCSCEIFLWVTQGWGVPSSIVEWLIIRGFYGAQRPRAWQTGAGTQGCLQGCGMAVYTAVHAGRAKRQGKQVFLLVRFAACCLQSFCWLVGWCFW